MHAFNRLGIAALIAFSVACGAAHATTQQYAFSATVVGTDGSLSGVTQGTTFTGSFGYDPTARPFYSSSLFSSYYFRPPAQIIATIGEHSVSSAALSAVARMGARGDYGIQFTGRSTLDGGSALTIDGTDYVNGAMSISLNGRAGNAGLPIATELPGSIDASVFDGYNTGWLNLKSSSPYDAPFTLEFAITSITAVPEPGTYGILLSGLGCLGYVVRRRKMTR